MIGLPQGKVEVVSYSSAWLYSEERDNLIKILGKQNILDIQHVGSTSIPDLDAKPIIDVAIAVSNFEESQKLVQPMINAGYTYRGENGIPRRHFFIKFRDNKSLFHVHMNEITSRDWNDQIYFRDYLLSHQKEAQKYRILKSQLAKEFPNDRESYTVGKNNFIQSILKTRALE